MRDRIDRLKVYLLGSAVFLMLVIAGYVVHARFMARLNHFKLPGNLGVDIVRESGGWSVCRSDGPRTLYCIHAVKVDQVKSGKVALHDVSIVLYGKKGDRRDRIYGQDFEYDEKAGIVRALGLVHIDLRVADGANETAGNPAGEGAASDADKGLPEGSHAEMLDPKLLHVTTSGLVYLEKLGVAATSEPIDFESGTIKGHATGADYSSDSGMLLLHSAVSMSGIEGGHPVLLDASSAQFDQRNQQAYLTKAKYSSQGRTVEANQATLYRRTNGTLQRVEAQGNVTLRQSSTVLVSERADVHLNAASQAESLLLSGNVLYTSNAPLKQARGQAREVTVTFNNESKPQPQHALFTGGVHLIERTRASENAREPWGVRDLTAGKVDAVFVSATNGSQPQLRKAEATGDAHLIVVNNGSVASASGQGRTEVGADVLRAALIPGADAKQDSQLDTIAGRGHTFLHQITAAGMDQTSTGDTLDAKFRPVTSSSIRPIPAVKGSSKDTLDADLGGDRLWSSVQQGHVTMTRITPAKKEGGRGAIEKASADRAAFDGDRKRLTLTGGVKLTNTGSVLWANQVELDRDTGDARMTGAVRVNYDAAQTEQPVAGSRSRQVDEPAHIVAERAEMEHAKDTTTFYGRPARLWQGASQIQAPVVEISRTQKRLTARGEMASKSSENMQSQQVHAMLSSAADTPRSAPAGNATSPGVGSARCDTGNAGLTKSGAGVAKGPPQVVRIASGGLTYSGVSRQADFTGGVRVDSVDATIQATQATAYLQQRVVQPPATDAVIPSLDGNLERMVASGNVNIVKPGLKALGDRLMYTASDRVFLLSGNNNEAAKAIDAQGTTTAAALRLQDSCDANGGVSVEALGQVPGIPAHRVRTESRITNDRKRGKAKE